MSKKINTEIFYCPICGNPLDISLEEKLDISPRENLIKVTCENCVAAVSRSSGMLAGQKINIDRAIERTLISYCEHAIESKALDVAYF